MLMFKFVTTLPIRLAIAVHVFCLLYANELQMQLGGAYDCYKESVLSSPSSLPLCGDHDATPIACTHAANSASSSKDKVTQQRARVLILMDVNEGKIRINYERNANFCLGKSAVSEC